MPKTECECCTACNSPLWKSIPYQEGVIHICSSCRLQWGNRRTNLTSVPTENQHYHSPSTVFSKEGGYPPYDEFFTTMEKTVGKRKLRILDVGCGSGAFIREALKRGHDPIGIEIDETLKQYMPQEILERVTFCSADTLDSLQEEQFDVITFWDSFEHMEFAFDLLPHIRKKLAPQGVLYLRVNNTRDIYNFCSLLLLRVWSKLGNKIMKSCFNFPDHVWNFSYQGMNKLMTKNNFAILFTAIGETPSWRLTNNKIFQLMIEGAYIFNRLIRGGKIANYYLVPIDEC